MNTSNNKRIAKNTAMLYFRMLITMVVSLYTSRIVLNTLGVEDFGIYNVVGGFVTMFGFVNSAMASATQRFLSFEIGKNDKFQLRNVFIMSVNIHVMISIVIFIFAETIGLWFVHTQLTIPQERVNAALWVFQFSIFSLMVNMLSVPYNAMIIAHEQMNVFAWVSIVEVILKLFIVFMLQWYGFDRLTFYAILMFFISLLIRIIYGIYCSRKFKESKFYLFWDKPLFKTLVNYAVWNLWGNAAGVIMGQGVNILLNMFFGPVVNAARAIAFQVKSAINQFVFNFQMALNPQIIKSFASSNIDYMHQLIFQGAKYSYFLLFALSLPIILEAEVILKLWLKIVPDYTVIFTQLVIINILIESISGPLMTAAQASGKIRVYQGIVGGLLILNLPVSYLFLKFGFSPEITLYISIAISIVAIYARLLIISPLVQMKKYNYLKYVIYRIVPVTLLSIVLPLIFRYTLQENFYRLVGVVFCSILSVGIAIYFVGLNKTEQQFINEKLKLIRTKITSK